MKIVPNDIKNVSWFEPQKAAEQLTVIFKSKIAEMLEIEIHCDHPHVEIAKVGSVSDPQFEASTYKPVCTSCNKVVEPIGYK